MRNVFLRYRFPICVTFVAATCWFVVAKSAHAQTERPPVIQGENRGSLGDIVTTRIRKPMDIDEQRVRAAGIQKFAGKHIDIYTDVRETDDIEELVEVFEQAIEFWCKYFEVDEDQVADWKVSCFVMVDRERFIRAAVYPRDLPPFPAGYQRGHEMWLYSQPGDYYTRHLFLHEGTHAFMNHHLGGVGGAWYGEGMAELLAVHRWSDEKLELNYRHNRREDVPYWGRVKLIKTDLENDKRLSLTDVMSAQVVDFQNIRWYGWAWAACRFFDSHPKYQNEFHQLSLNVTDHTLTFSTSFWKKLGESDSKAHEELNRDWNLFLNDLDYGINVEAILTSEIGRNEDGTFELAAHRGWQDTGLNISEGQEIEISAEGQFIVRREGSDAWTCEANGITIEYVNGLPMGRLVAAIQTEEDLTTGSFAPIDVGQRAKIRSPKTGRLFLKINDEASEFFDNEGSLTVSVK